MLLILCPVVDQRIHQFPSLPFPPSLVVPLSRLDSPRLGKFRFRFSLFPYSSCNLLLHRILSAPCFFFSFSCALLLFCFSFLPISFSSLRSSKEHSLVEWRYGNPPAKCMVSVCPSLNSLHSSYCSLPCSLIALGYPPSALYSCH
ncbi:hypothetical protein BDW62DRAFT_73652 [Aspergillus aurantiobrunneus]